MQSGNEETQVRLKTKGGVYVISNTLTGDCYIGSSVDISKRWQQHRALLRIGAHHSARFQQAWDRYGEDVFLFAVLEDVTSPQDLALIEQRHMNERKPKYNASLVAINHAGHANLSRPKQITVRKVSEMMTKALEEIKSSYEHAFNIVYPLEDSSPGITLVRTLLLAVSPLIKTKDDFIQFLNAGYRALYGETEDEIRIRMGLPAGAFILDYMDNEELATNLMRIESTCSVLARVQVQDLHAACQIHETVSQTVRETIIQLGNTPPEQLAKATKSIDQAAKDEERRRTRGMDLFPEIDAPDNDASN